MKSKKRFYYKFWIKSSRGTNASIVKLYKARPTKQELERDIEKWASNFGAWHVSENVVHYGWKEVTKLPKNRNEALLKHNALCNKISKLSEKRNLIRNLLQVPPFNGRGVPA